MMPRRDDRPGACVSFEGEHPDENTLVEYVRGALSQHGRQQVNIHVDECDGCRRTLAALARHVSVRTGNQASSDFIVTQPETLGATPGTVLDGRFRIDNLLGGGAMGVVFEAEDLQLKEKVAVKLLSPAVVQRGDALELLRREILLARRVSHPNVCPVYDLGITGQHHYITMKLIQGRTLDQLLDEGPVEAERAARLLEQLASALATAHAKGVVHRDLKAANVMVSKDDHLWVMDFGLARDLERDPSFSGPVGTPAYWAPEQALGEPATGASDVYSFGVVAYRLFTGKLPKRFTQKTNFDLVPAPWRRIVTRCMSERTNARYQDGAELLAAWRQVGSWKNRVPVMVAVAVAAMTVVGVMSQRTPEPPVTNKPPEPIPAAVLPQPIEPKPPPGPVVEPTVAGPTVEPVVLEPGIDSGVRTAAPKKGKKKPRPADDIPLFE
jgi:serine/threonine protein kinase